MTKTGLLKPLQPMQNNLKKYRNEAGLTQGQMSEMTGLDLRYMQRYEKASDIKMSNAVLLSLALNRPVTDVFDFGVTPGENNNDTTQHKAVNEQALMLKNVRESAGLSPKETAGLLGIPLNDYRQLESGNQKISQEEALKLCTAIIFWHGAKSISRTDLSIINSQPDVPEQEFLRIFKAITPDKRPQAIAVLKTFINTEN